MHILIHGQARPFIKTSSQYIMGFAAHNKVTMKKNWVFESLSKFVAFTIPISCTIANFPYVNDVTQFDCDSHYLILFFMK